MTTLRGRLSLGLLVALAGPVSAQSALPQAAPSQAPYLPTLVLEDQFEQSRDVAAHRGNVLVLVYGDRQSLDVNRALADQLHLYFHPSAQGLPPTQARQAPVRPLSDQVPGTRPPDVRAFPVVCMTPLPAAVHSLVRAQVRRAVPDVSVWLDFDDQMRRQFGLAPGVPNVIVLDTAGSLRYALSGTLSSEQLGQLAAAVEGLRREAPRTAVNRPVLAAAPNPPAPLARTPRLEPPVTKTGGGWRPSIVDAHQTVSPTEGTTITLTLPTPPPKAHPVPTSALSVPAPPPPAPMPASPPTRTPSIPPLVVSRPAPSSAPAPSPPPSPPMSASPPPPAPVIPRALVSRPAPPVPAEVLPAPAPARLRVSSVPGERGSAAGKIVLSIPAPPADLPSEAGVAVTAMEPVRKPDREKDKSGPAAPGPSLHRLRVPLPLLPLCLLVGVGTCLLWSLTPSRRFRQRSGRCSQGIGMVGFWRCRSRRWSAGRSLK